MTEKRVHIRNITEVTSKHLNNMECDLILDTIGEKNGEYYKVVLHLDEWFLPDFVYAITSYYKKVQKDINISINNIQDSVDKMGESE